MTEKQVRQVIERYRTYLSLAGDEPQVANFDLPPTRGEAIRHMLHMCDQMDALLDEAAGLDDNAELAWEKVNRWLGFMQGTLWSMGTFTLNEMRGHNTCSLSS